MDSTSGWASRGAGVVLEGSGGFLLEQSLIFKFKASNNQAKYEALIAGLQLAQNMGGAPFDMPDEFSFSIGVDEQRFSSEG